MENKIKNLLAAELFWTDEELSESDVVSNTVKCVETLMEEQEMSEDSAINYVLFGDKS